MITPDTLIFQFFMFSMCGWILEVSYRSISQKRFVNPGFNRGPWVPLYGTASALLVCTGGLLEGQSIALRALVYFAVTTGMEFATGEMMLRIFRKRYWDYRDTPLHLRGHVSLPFSIAWVGACFFFEIFLLPGSEMVISLLEPLWLRSANAVLALLLAADFTVSSGLPVRAAELGRKYGTAVTGRLGELPDEMGTLLFSSPILKLARRQFVTVINDERIRQAEEELRRRKNQVCRKSLSFISKFRGGRA